MGGGETYCVTSNLFFVLRVSQKCMLLAYLETLHLYSPYTIISVLYKARVLQYLAPSCYCEIINLPKSMELRELLEYKAKGDKTDSTFKYKTRTYEN